MSATLEPILDVRQIAERLGVKNETIHDYHKKGLMPEADDYLGRTPIWFEETIQEWEDNRPRAARRKS